MFTGCVPDSVRSRTLGTLLEMAGYTTGYAGKWHAHTSSLPDRHAFGFENLHVHNDFGLAEAAVEFLKRKHDKPFFLVASFDNPHNICEYARNQKLPYATIEEPDLDECPNLPANHSVAPYDAAMYWLTKCSKVIGFILHKISLTMRTVKCCMIWRKTREKCAIWA